jgi:hypothetical protein
VQARGAQLKHFWQLPSLHMYLMTHPLSCPPPLFLHLLYSLQRQSAAAKEAADKAVAEAREQAATQAAALQAELTSAKVRRSRGALLVVLHDPLSVHELAISSLHTAASDAMLCCTLIHCRRSLARLRVSETRWGFRRLPWSGSRARCVRHRRVSRTWSSRCVCVCVCGVCVCGGGGGSVTCAMACRCFQ